MEEKNNNTQEIIIYQTDDGAVKIDVQMADDTVWLTIDGMSKLFEKSRSTINEHILNIFEEGELNKVDVVRKIGNSDFSTKPTNYYNLDVIISVGCKVDARHTVPHLGNQIAHEYKKYQQRTLSQEEKDFLDNIKTLPNK